MSASVSRTRHAPGARRAARPTVVLPAPIGPTRTTTGRSARRSPEPQRVEVAPATLRRVSATESPPNFSSTASASTSATIASATMPAAGTAHTSERWWWATGGLAGGDVDGAQRPRARWRSASSRRAPAAPRRWSCRPRCRRSGRRCGGCRRRSATISSCACEPGVRGELEAVADLDALDRLDAHQRAGEPGVEPAVPVHVRAEARRQRRRRGPRRRRRGCRRPCGPGRSRRPSPSLASASRQRTGSASSARDVVGRRARTPSGAVTPPSSTTWRDDLERRRPARGSCEATAPSATRAAVSRAVARSRIGRASSKPYFCMPTRSAWPGRGRVSGGVAGQRRRARPGRPGRPT